MKKSVSPTISAIFIAWAVASPAGELFSVDGSLLPSEKAALEEWETLKAEAAQRSRGPIEQLQTLSAMQPLMKGDCEGFPRLESQASEGDARDQYYVGLAFLNGWCVAADFDRGLDWMFRAAKGDYDQAAVEYAKGVFGEIGQGAQVSQEKQATAVELLKDAAEGFNSDANTLLGILYSDGAVVPKDVKLAEDYFAAASVGGNDNAIYPLGRLLLEQQQVDKALEWFEIGAVKGLAENQIMAAALLSDASGPEGYVEAYKWANIAATRSEQQALVNAAQKIQAQLEELMTPEQISEAQSLSSAFVAEPFAQVPSSRERKPKHQYSYEELVDPTATPDQIAAREKLKQLNIPINRMAFFDAIEEDDFELVTAFIQAGASLETRAIGVSAPRGVTPLYVAVDWGAKQTFRFLMEQNVQLDTAASVLGYTPLVRALTHERYDWAEELLDAGADATMQETPDVDLLSSSALGLAVGTDKVSLVERILEQGGSVEERYAGDMTPLQQAIRFGGSTGVIRVLLEEDADPNAVGNSETMLDATFDQDDRSVRTDAMALLLEFGADPELSENMGGSLLVVAATIGNPGAIRLLVEAGADPNRQVQLGNDEIATVFEDPVERDVLRSGVSPLAMAALMGNTGAATALIELGADPRFVVEGDTGTYSISDLASRAGVTIPGL